MTKTVFSVQDLCERWGFTPPTIRKLEELGVLERCLREQGAVRYTARSVYAAERSEFQPYRDREMRLEKKLAEVQAENARLRGILFSVAVQTGEFAGGMRA